MKPTFNEKLIAYLTLLSGLSISAVAVYYSVVGLTAIFAAAVIPIVIMGVTLEVSKLVATVWLKQNWNIAPKTIRLYLTIAVIILMLITSLGIFGFLSKAHSDQSFVSGDVLAKIAVYDERIKTAKENIEADRRQLKQMDEAVDQVMARSTTEQGADKSVAIRKAQARDRAALAKSIEANQKLIASLNNEAAPIRAEVRKVEAEVGPLKYIASFIYGETDKTILEKAVTWVIIIIVVVFDPLAVVLLLASQYSFQSFRLRTLAEKSKPEITPAAIEPQQEINSEVPEAENNKHKFVQKQIGEIWKAMDQPCVKCGNTMTYFEDVGVICTNTNCGEQEVETITLTDPTPHKDEFDISKHPYLFIVPENRHPPGVEAVGPQVYKPTPDVVDARLSTQEALNLEDIEKVVQDIESNVEKLFIQNEEQAQSNLWTTASITTSDISSNEYVKASIERRNKLIDDTVQKVKEGRMPMTEIPEDILSAVKSRV